MTTRTVVGSTRLKTANDWVKKLVDDGAAVSIYDIPDGFPKDARNVFIDVTDSIAASTALKAKQAGMVWQEISQTILGHECLESKPILTFNNKSLQGYVARRKIKSLTTNYQKNCPTSKESTIKILHEVLPDIAQNNLEAMADLLQRINLFASQHPNEAVAYHIIDGDQAFAPVLMYLLSSTNPGTLLLNNVSVALHRTKLTQTSSYSGKEVAIFSTTQPYYNYDSEDKATQKFVGGKSNTTENIDNLMLSRAPTEELSEAQPPEQKESQQQCWATTFTKVDSPAQKSASEKSRFETANPYAVLAHNP